MDTENIQKAEALKEERLKEGEAILQSIRADMPSGACELPADVAEPLRDLLFASESWAKTSGKPQASDEPVEAPFAATSVMIPKEFYITLCKALGVPSIRVSRHGECKDCVFGPEDRGWGGPCGGCDWGHPCFLPK